MLLAPEEELDTRDGGCKPGDTPNVQQTMCLLAFITFKKPQFLESLKDVRNEQLRQENLKPQMHRAQPLPFLHSTSQKGNKAGSWPGMLLPRAGRVSSSALLSLWPCYYNFPDSNSQVRRRGGRELRVLVGYSLSRFLSGVSEDHLPSTSPISELRWLWIYTCTLWGCSAATLHGLCTSKCQGSPHSPQPP